MKKIIPYALLLSFSISSLFAAAGNVSADEVSDLLKDAPKIEAAEQINSEDLKEVASVNSFDEVLEQYGDRIREMTPEEAEKAKEVGVIDVKTPQELAALLKESENIEAKMNLEEELFQWKTTYTPEIATNVVTMAAKRSSYLKEIELADWGSLLFKTYGRLIGRTQIYYWSDTLKIDQTTVTSFMDGTVSGREWAPDTPVVVSPANYYRIVQYLGTLKQFSTVNGQKSYTTFTTIRGRDTIVPPGFTGPIPN
ncbi:hypothetical protein [Paenibacillus polysaccharolyticus]|uniref:hypothetical protein n=1 Tax=Paenibacillus polysaccharolyticus TaxID=582692 RepID=UPI00280B5F5E|nr:hypothetical protein [Paenibacillus polysaccharolyticus]